ncbi:MAG: hypothetical protein K2P94_11940 [Rhodospirillaceae bacterium]|nr:hypothetical protein [Rhodospirillaceae bacterium]
MFKVVCFAAVLTAGLVSVAYADSFRPGASPAGGRIGKFCNTDLLSAEEQKDCIRRFKKAKSDDERRELVGSLQDTFKARQKEADKEYERLNPGGRNGPQCTGQQCQ